MSPRPQAPVARGRRQLGASALALSISISLFAASEGIAGFLGSAVTANYSWPSVESVLYAGGSAIVGTGLEFPGVGAANIRADFSDTGFRITYPTGWTFGNVTPKTFDGWVITASASVPDLTGARLVGSNISGASNLQIAFDAKHVYVNQLGYSSFPANSYIDVAVDFAGSSSLPSVAIIYAVASDGVDRKLDTDGTLVNSVGSWNNWLRSQTGGRALRVDMRDGLPDITFVRLHGTESSYEAQGVYIRDALEAELRARGFLQQGKIYGLYYDGPAAERCGGASYPPSLPGQVGALYLRGRFANPRIPPCSSNPFASSPTAPPGYVELSMLHEIVHVLGYVPSCGRNQVLAGHVSDNQHDLMYADAAKPWLIDNPVLDFNRDDYYGHGRADCPDLANDPFLQPSGYSLDYLQMAYVAYYGRPADPEGQNYWASRMDAESRSLDAVIVAFGNSSEFNRRYGGLAHPALITSVYQQLLGRNPDAAGLAYYVGEMQSGRRTLQGIALDVINGATTPPDSTVVANKLAVAAYYSAKVAAGCAYGMEQDGVNALSGVTALATTVAGARASIDSRCGP